MNKKQTAILRKGDGLLLVDVQNDFCPGGKLPIEDGDKVVPVLNEWIDAAVAKSVPVYASRDWHPIHHISFLEQGGKWPQHCLADSEGADFHPGLDLPESIEIVTKGVRFDQDQRSAFDQTGFATQLKREGVKRLFVGGLAQDVCVLETVLDALKAGFEVMLIKDGTRPVDAEGGKLALKRMEREGAVIL